MGRSKKQRIMEKLTMIWGWNPPQYEVRTDGILLFFTSKETTREVIRKDTESDVERVETINEWLCDTVMYVYDDLGDMAGMMRENPESLECQKWMVKRMIEAYDGSSYVNTFTVGGYPTWLDKATRVGLKMRFEAEKRMGKTETILWQGGMQFRLPLVGETTALDMLYGIELYASSCYDVTQMHLAKVDVMESVEELKGYDYTSDYPEKLRFEV